jgi:DNA polymerase-3 subunit gamma/tau
MQQQEQEKAKLKQQDLPAEPFTKEDFLRWWKTNAHLQKSNEQDQLYAIMTKRDPIQVAENEFHLEVENTIQQNRIEVHLSEIIDFIREKLKNYQVNMKVVITTTGVDENQFLTGKDRFEKLAKKNNNLFDLKNRFNLDIEY